MTPRVAMRRRSAKANQTNRIYLLVSLSLFFWALIFYFHFSVIGSCSSSNIEKQIQLQPTYDQPQPSSSSSSISLRVDKFPLDPPKEKEPLVAKPVLPPEFSFVRALKTTDNKSDPCEGKYIYVHDLPSRFNEDMLRHCKKLSLWTNMCKFTTNAGLGHPLENVEGFAVDVIFSNQMKQYKCLMDDSSLTASIFVPFYAGFGVARDAASLELVDWLMKRPEWEIMRGKDHSLWRRKLIGGTSFSPYQLPRTCLCSSSPWNANDFGIPYPTYFHSAKDSEVFEWQERMRNLDRKWLFSFAGAPRPDNPKSIRGQIIDQCRNSNVGKLLECDFGESKCHAPSSITKMFQGSLFCLQPQRDSYTRRSAFDSMLVGCIPVFFHPGSAYTQYKWHLPKNYTTYSVFICEDDIRKRNMSIKERLLQIPPEQVKIMRENVIKLITGLIYADPRSGLETLKDAFDISVEAIIDKVTRLRKNMIKGRTEYDSFVEENSWKYVLLEEGQREAGRHVWDPFLSKPNPGEDSSSEGSGGTTISADAAKNSWKSE
ncbi:hypothetical protein Bca52824_016829 [Brassica carinata]|uniref:Exostosin GT47 domain-containing protein n=1 Tax=Brassica carinata TaxID=52824 RepID=A0A8X7W4S8_BRACI|nr:hypothetical protein Bca52824_016829 [Brassica carinata]